MASIKVNNANVADDLGIDKVVAGAGTLNSVDAIMLSYAQVFIEAAQKRINSKGNVDTGKMSDIEVSTVQFINGKWSLTIGYDPSNPASKYYDFQNKGVRGIKSGSPNSIYAFRTLNVSPKMVQAIMAWYTRHRNYIKNETHKKGLSRLQRKRRKIVKSIDPTKTLMQVAENTAKRIKERGIKRVGFFEDNMKIFGKKFQQDVAKAIGKNIAVNIKQILERDTNGNNNK